MASSPGESKSIADYVKPVRVTLSEILLETKKLDGRPGLQLSRGLMTSVVRNASNIKESLDLFRALTSENQAVLQSVLDTVEVCRDWLVHVRQAGAANEGAGGAQSEEDAFYAKSTWDQFVSGDEGSVTKSKTTQKSG